MNCEIKAETGNRIREWWKRKRGRGKGWREGVVGGREGIKEMDSEDMKMMEGIAGRQK